MKFLGEPFFEEKGLEFPKGISAEPLRKTFSDWDK